MQKQPADPHNLATGSDEASQTVLIATEGTASEEAARKIEAVLGDADGVVQARADVESARVAVTFDARKTNVAELHETVLQAGYAPEPFSDPAAFASGDSTSEEDDGDAAASSEEPSNSSRRDE
jgi:copper chaperone CopZ